MNHTSEKSTLVDRVGVALFSGFSSFIVGTIVWFILAFVYGLLLSHDSSDSIDTLSFYPVLFFSVGMAVLGFLLKIDLVTTVISKLLHGIFQFGKYW